MNSTGDDVRPHSDFRFTSLNGEYLESFATELGLNPRILPNQMRNLLFRRNANSIRSIGDIHCVSSGLAELLRSLCGNARWKQVWAGIPIARKQRSRPDMTAIKHNVFE